MTITFRQLEVFRAVAETRSFTRASHILHISQSTVSQHVRDLETSLQVTLFERNRRRVSLSSAGDNLLEHSQRIFHLLDQAERDAKAVTDPYSGTLSLGVASTTILYQLPAILREYKNRYPTVDIYIYSGTVQEIASQMWSRSIDVAVVVLPISGPEFKQILLLKEPFVAVLPIDHPLAKRSNIEIRHLAAETFILNRRGLNTRQVIDRFFFKNKINPRVGLELDETEAIKEMVARGFGVSILPVSAFSTLKRQYELKTFPIGSKDLHRSLGLVYLQSKPLSARAQALLALLQSHLIKS